jgi:carbonic anhydrase/acetyltransferase-like protein (isoleucine patch superfamily)
MIRSFRGNTPGIHPDAFISEAAYVIGAVEVGPGSGVWPGAVLRGDFQSIRIGAHTQVEDNVVVHGRVEIGDHVTIGHSVVIHGKKIGSFCLIGNNATILDDSEIGDYCVIGANALVSARMQVPAESFVVGVPGEIRPLPDNMRKRLGAREAGPYADLVKQYKAEGLVSEPVEETL